MEITSQQIVDKLNQLPDDLKSAFLSVRIDEKSQVIGKKYNLHIDKIGSLVFTIKALALGLLKIEDLSNKFTTELGVTKDVADQIKTEVVENIIKEIKKIWVENISKEKERENEDEDDWKDWEPGSEIAKLSPSEREKMLKMVAETAVDMPGPQETHDILVKAGLEHEVTDRTEQIGIEGYSLRNKNLAEEAQKDIEEKLGGPVIDLRKVEAKNREYQSESAQKIESSDGVMAEERNKILEMIENPSPLLKKE
ncbi:MAG: hypothetical protein US50_C0007G0011, partial [Candidatus Nomurabacteria bacterium GW2011_GWB1_37_5]